VLEMMAFSLKKDANAGALEEEMCKNEDI